MTSRPALVELRALAHQFDHVGAVELRVPPVSTLVPSLTTMRWYMNHVHWKLVDWTMTAMNAGVWPTPVF